MLSVVLTWQSYQRKNKRRFLIRFCDVSSIITKKETRVFEFLNTLVFTFYVFYAIIVTL